MSDESVPCPECGEDWPDDVQEGDSCDGCGVLYSPDTDDDDEESVDGEHDVEDDNG